MQSRSHRQQPKIDPFAFPPETNGRFNMLILGILMIAIYTLTLFVILGTFLFDLALVRDLEWMILETDAMRSLQEDRNLFALPREDVRRLAALMQQTSFIAFITGLPRLGIFVVYLLLILGTAYAVYRSHLWIARRVQRLRPLTAFANREHAADIERNVSQIATSVGITPPQVMIKTHPRSEGQALGLPSRYMLSLNGWPWYGLDELTDLWRRTQKRDEFRALVLHELGHIKNHDIWRAKFAQAIFWTFVGCVLLPLVILALRLFLWPLSAEPQLFIHPNNAVWTASSLMRLIVQIVALLLVIGASYAALLRVREFYADWRSELWGAGIALREGLRTAPMPERRKPVEYVFSRLPGVMQRLWLRVGGWWQYHSSPQERIDRLDDPRSLFNVSSELGFQTGVLLGFIQLGVPVLLIMYFYPILAQLNDMLTWTLVPITIDLPPPLDRASYVFLIVFMRLVVEPILVLGLSSWVAYLVTESLGQQVMRAAIADLIPGAAVPWGYVRLVRPAFWLAVGQEVGFLIIPTGMFTIHDSISLMLIPVLTLIFTFFTWLWLIYVRLLSRVLLGSYAGTARPRLRRWLVMVASTIMLWAIYLPILPLRVTIVVASTVLGLPDDISSLFMPMADFVPFWGFMLFILVNVSFLLFMTFLVFSLGVAGLWSISQSPRCPVCREAASTSMVVGLRCAACYSLLAAWLYLAPRRPV